MNLLELKAVRYRYEKNRREVLCGVDFTFETGTVYAVTGRSGAGKSTLLSLMNGLLLPTSGEVCFQGRSTATLDRLAYRRTGVSVIFQDYGLFPLLTAMENICYPMELCGLPKERAREEARRLAALVELPEALLDRYPSALSGGEQQRVAIARGLSMERRLLLADEPTGNLDGATADQIVSLLWEAAHAGDRCLILITHDPEVARRADHTLRLQDGLLLPV